MTIIPKIEPSLEVVVQPIKWLWTEEVRGQYIVYDKDLRVVLNYLGKVGVKSVFRKIRSRLYEHGRNQKVWGVGFGLIRKGGSNEDGDFVFFLATNHNKTWKYLTLNRAFIRKIDLKHNGLSTCTSIVDLISGDLRRYIGWSKFSGIEVDKVLVAQSLKEICQKISWNFVGRVGEISLQGFSYFKKHQAREISFVDKPSAVLFGLGNYAKVNIIPNIRPYLNLKRIHEVDPSQLLSLRKNKYELFCSGEAEVDAKFDAWFIAGYHHTHCDLAMEALKSGAYAVIEKPLVTTESQYNAFLNVVRSSGRSKFFGCFHKRYSVLHDFAIKDLGLGQGEAVDMHSIVFEIPLPVRHWYNWPSSGSRMISNGCHWVDYFMYVNDYSPVEFYDIWNGRDTDLSVRVRLVNGAILNLTLTDSGSSRLGVRDYIELRARDITVRMIDGDYYDSENRSRVLRRRKTNLTKAYGRMYRRISELISLGQEGDSIESLRSSELTVLLDKEIRK